jgi:8-oxo-dGTP pyrophosphatase MutT (NUDIX family)
MERLQVASGDILGDIRENISGGIIALLRNGVMTLLFRLFLTVRALLAPSVLGVAAAIYDAQGRVLLVRHSYNPGWRLPGGGVNRGEPPLAAIRREMAEEVGLSGGEAAFFALYSGRAGWATHVVALYRFSGAATAFRPNWEIRETCFADPAAPPDGCTAATLRRLAELTGAAAISQLW